MTPDQKARLKREYKEKTTRKGVFRVHCTATGQNWVDASPTLDTIQNRIWFSLRMGNHRNRELQQAWAAAGAEAMQFEILEALPEDTPEYKVERLMKERRAYWMGELNASACL